MLFPELAYSAHAVEFFRPSPPSRDEAYTHLAWEGQRRYLEAVEGMTDKEVRRRVLMLARLLKRWERGW